MAGNQARLNYLGAICGDDDIGLRETSWKKLIAQTEEQLLAWYAEQEAKKIKLPWKT